MARAAALVAPVIPTIPDAPIMYRPACTVTPTSGFTSRSRPVAWNTFSVESFRKFASQSMCNTLNGSGSVLSPHTSVLRTRDRSRQTLRLCDWSRWRPLLRRFQHVRTLRIIRVAVADVQPVDVPPGEIAPATVAVATIISTHSGYTVIQLDEVRQALRGERPAECAWDSACIQKVADRLKADLVVFYVVALIDKKFELTIDLVDPKKPSDFAAHKREHAKADQPRLEPVALPGAAVQVGLGARVSGCAALRAGGGRRDRPRGAGRARSAAPAGCGPSAAAGATLPSSTPTPKDTRSTAPPRPFWKRTSALRQATSWGRNFTILTSDNMLSIMADNGIDPNKACEANCSLQAARELKADVFVSANVAMTEGMYTAIMRLFESANGRQLSSIVLEGATVRDLRKQYARKAGSSSSTCSSCQSARLRQHQRRRQSWRLPLRRRRRPRWWFRCLRSLHQSWW